jgi:hypothetical protein
MKYLEEAAELEKRWVKSEIFPNLADIKDDFKRSAICVLLENQRLINECAEFGESINKKLLDLVFSTYSNLLAWDIISIQPMLGPTALIFYVHKNLSGYGREYDIKDCSVAAYTKTFSRKFCLDFGVEDASKDIRYELDTEFLVDLWNTAASVASYEKDIHEEQLRLCLESFIEQMEKKLGSKVNWMVVKESLHFKYKEIIESFGLKVHIDRSETPIKGILLGRKGDSSMDAGYFYTPYVPFAFAPSFDGSYRIHTRYGKKLIDPDYYGRITIAE